MTLTFVLTIFWDLELGIAVSLVISLLLVVHRSSKTRMTILVRESAMRIRLKPKTITVRAASLALIHGNQWMRTRRRRKMLLVC